MPGPAQSTHMFSQLDAALERTPTTSAHYRVFLMVAAGSLFNVIEQYNAGYASPVLRDLWGLSATAVSALSTATFLAMAAGSLATGYLADRFGRKYLFMVNVGLYTAGSLLAALAPNYLTLFIARVIIGMGLGGEIGLGYTVLAEIVKAKVRGAFASSLALISSGVGVFAASGLAALILGPLSTPLGGESIAWRWLFGIMVIPAFLILFFRRYIPETPRYLLRQGHVEEVNAILSRFAAGKLSDGAGVETKTWITAAEGTRVSVGQEKVAFSELFVAGLRRRTFVAWALTLAQFGGFATFAIFTPTLFEARGLSVSSSLLFATVANFAGLIGAAVGVLTAQYMRRRAVYAIGGAVLVFTIGALATTSSAVLTLTLAALMQFVFQTVNSTNWCYLPELFPTRVRAVGAGTATTVGMLASGFGPLVAGALIDGYGIPAVFLFLGVLVSVFCVASRFGPETRGIDLVEVASDIEEERNPIGA
ncbi:MFS transporter (plasmid) [Rhodococcus opacus]